MSRYFAEGTVFNGLEKKELHHYSHFKDPVECGRCKGYGLWVRSLSAHGPERNSLQGCGACNGWGFVEEGQCLHRWDGPERNVGQCLHEWTCSACGDKRIVDSSD